MPFGRSLEKEGKAKQRRENQPDAEGVEAGADHRPQPDVGPYQIANDQDGQAEHLYRHRAEDKARAGGVFTQRATDRLAMITALKTGTWLQANSLVVSPPASIKITGDTATQLISGI